MVLWLFSPFLEEKVVFFTIEKGSQENQSVKGSQRKKIWVYFPVSTKEYKYFQILVIMLTNGYKKNDQTNCSFKKKHSLSGK